MKLKDKKILIPGPVRAWIRTTFVYQLTGANEQEAVVFLLRTALSDSVKADEKRKWEESKRLLREIKP